MTIYLAFLNNNYYCILAFILEIMHNKRYIILTFRFFNSIISYLQKTTYNSNFAFSGRKQYKVNKNSYC